MERSVPWCANHPVVWSHFNGIWFNFFDSFLNQIFLGWSFVVNPNFVVFKSKLTFSFEKKRLFVVLFAFFFLHSKLLIIGNQVLNAPFLNIWIACSWSVCAVCSILLSLVFVTYNSMCCLLWIKVAQSRCRVDVTAQGLIFGSSGMSQTILHHLFTLPSWLLSKHTSIQGALIVFISIFCFLNL